MPRKAWDSRPGAAGLVGDGIDNNNNGGIDEGVIKRMEMVVDRRRRPVKVRRTISTVVRDVAWDPVNQAAEPGLQSFPDRDSTGTAYPITPPDCLESARRLFVSLTLEKADPRTPEARP